MNKPRSQTDRPLSSRCPQCGNKLHLLTLDEVFVLLREDEPELERVLLSDHAWQCSNCGEGRAVWTDEELLVHFHPNEARVLRQMEEEELSSLRRAKPPSEPDYDADAYMNWFDETDSDEEADEDLLDNGFTTLDNLDSMVGSDFEDTDESF